MKKEDDKKTTVITYPKCREEVSNYIETVVEHLKHTGVMSELDPIPLSILGVQLDIFAEAAACLRVEGLMVHDEKENLVPNPKIEIMNKAETMALKIMKEYGLLPKSRKELGKSAEPKKDSPLGAFLKK